MKPPITPRTLPTVPLRLPLVAVLALAALAMAFAFVPSVAPAQDNGQWDWDDQKDNNRSGSFVRPRPSGEGHNDRREVLLLRARGDLGAVLADGLSTHPALNRRYHIVRLDNDRGRDNADHVLCISAVQMRQDQVGAGNGGLVVILTLVHPATAQVLAGDRHVYGTLDDAFRDLADLGKHIDELRSGHDDHDDGNTSTPDPDAGSNVLPGWVTRPVQYVGYIAAVGTCANARTESPGYAAAENDARQKITAIVQQAARDCVVTYYGKRNRRVSPQIPGGALTIAFETTHRAAQPQPNRFTNCYAEVRTKIADTRQAFFAAATTAAQSVMRGASLDSQEIQRHYSDWLRAKGYTVVDQSAEPEPEPEPPAKLSDRRDLGGGWAMVTAEVTAESVVHAQQIAKDYALYCECSNDVQSRWDRVRASSQFSGALGSYCMATITNSTNNGNGTWTVKVSLRLNYRQFEEWAKRVLGLR